MLYMKKSMENPGYSSIQTRYPIEPYEESVRMNTDKQCNFVYGEIFGATEEPFKPTKIRIIKRRLAYYGFLVVRKVLPRISSPLSPRLQPEENLNLQPGDWVEVRSKAEIYATLDPRGKFKGLGFMPEMEKFCGKRFRVWKKVSMIALESTGEMRRLRSPTVFLEGAFCDGGFHYNCDRSCFCFWREAWLRRVTDEKG
jgi:hypothetical protein